MKWVKLTKHFQGGVKTDYLLVEDERVEGDSNQQELMEEWGEYSDGGHAYGYRVDMEVLGDAELPPMEWLEKSLKRTNEAIKYLDLKLKRTREELAIIENLINNV